MEKILSPVFDQLLYKPLQNYFQGVETIVYSCHCLMFINCSRKFTKTNYCKKTNFHANIWQQIILLLFLL